MMPHVAVIWGFQAGCNDDECATDEVGIALGERGHMALYRWWGGFHESYIDAALDATLHNIENHPEEISHGRHDADELSALRTH